MRISMLTALAVLGTMAAGVAQAQTACPDGKTFTGACVKAGLGETVRKHVQVYTQPKISYTAPAVLPSEDGAFASPRDYNELIRIFSVGRPGSGITCVPSRSNPCP